MAVQLFGPYVTIPSVDSLFDFPGIQAAENNSSAQEDTT